MSFFFPNVPFINKISCRNAFAATKFDPDAFSKILEHLHNSIRIDLSMFRTVFRYDDKTQKAIEELKHKIDLLKQISFFRANILGISSIPAIQVVQECIRACMKSSYNFIFNNCDKMMSDHTGKEKQSESDQGGKQTATTSDDELGVKNANNNESSRNSESPFKGPSMQNLDFWMSLVGFVAQIMNEVKSHYTSGFNQFNGDLDISALASCFLFELMQNDIHDAMVEHCNQRIKEKAMIAAGQMMQYSIPNSSYMSLQFRIKWLYSGFVSSNKDVLNSTTNEEGVLVITTYADKTFAIEYPLYFEQFTTDWLEEMVPVSQAFVKAAYEKDQKDDFQITNDAVLHSNSVLDIFSVINQNMDILKRLESPIKETHDKYFYLFSVNISHVLNQYTEIMCKDFKQVYCNPVKEEIPQTPCVMLNNIQQLRVQLEKVFTSMGGDDMSSEAQEVLRDQQLILNNMLDDLCLYFGEGFEPKIKKCMTVMASILHGEITSDKQDSVEAADKILQPLLAKLDPLLESFLMICEKTVLKRILKAFWTLVIVQLEKIVVLPRRGGMGLGNLLDTGVGAAGDLIGKVGDLSKHVKNLGGGHSDTSGIEAIAKNAGKDTEFDNLKTSMIKINQPLSQKQCEVIKIVIANLKQYFYNDGYGLKKAHINKSEELSSLENALNMYNKSCHELITLFINTQKDQMMVRQGDYPNYGVLELQLELKKQGPKGSLSVRLVQATDLNWPTNNFKPYVEIILTGPKLEGQKHRYTTKSKYGASDPKFNETFQFMFGTSECPLSCYEIQFHIKDYCLFRDDRIVGLGCIQLSEILLFKHHQTQSSNINATSVVGQGGLRSMSNINNVAQNNNENNSSNPDNQSLNSTNSNFKSKSFQMLPNGFIVCKLNLLKRLHVDENGWTILRILGQRGSKDAMAREFMNLKSATRNDPVSN